MGTLFGVSCGVVVLALAVALPAQAAERWTGTLTRLTFVQFERHLPSPDEPVSFSFAPGAREIRAFAATVYSFCPDDELDEYHFRQLTHPDPVPVGGDGQFSIAGGVQGEPGSWRFDGAFRRDLFGNIVRDVVGRLTVEPTVEGCTVEDSLGRPTDPHWRAFGPPLPRPRVKVSVKHKGFGSTRITVRVRNHKGNRVAKARVRVAPEADFDLEWKTRHPGRDGRATFTVGLGDYALEVGGRGIAFTRCTMRIEFSKPVKLFC